jgi:pimeloyl-ACP methyl ester carboxylesterase
MAVAGRVRMRALILQGSRDRTASPSGAKRLARELAGPVTVQMFPRSGHVLPLDVEGPAVSSAVVSFFQEG